MNKGIAIKFIYLFIVIFTCLPGDAAPQKVDSIIIRNFVIKCHIILTNAKPTHENVKLICRKYDLYNNFKTGSSDFIDSLLNSVEFSQNIFDKYRYEYLQGVSLEDIKDEVKLYKKFLEKPELKSMYSGFNDIIRDQSLLYDAANDLAIGSINIEEVQKRAFLSNTYYEMNNGVDNFVISTFNYLLFRNPTSYELEKAKSMCSNIYGTFLFQKGVGKQGYLNAIFSSGAYWEGQVIYWYKSILNRNATLDEVAMACSQTRDMKHLIKEILLKKEFSGI